MIFKFDSSVSGPTILYLSKEYYYPEGFEVILFKESGAQIPQSEYTVSQSPLNLADIEVSLLNE